MEFLERGASGMGLRPLFSHTDSGSGSSGRIQAPGCGGCQPVAAPGATRSGRQDLGELVLAVNVGEALVTALVEIGQLFVIDAEEP